MAEKFGFAEDVDENGCVVTKVYYQLLRKTSRKGRYVDVCNPCFLNCQNGLLLRRFVAFIL